MNENIEPKKQKVMTPEFRVSFPSVFKPTAMMVGGKPQGEPKYGLTMLIPKTADITKMKELLAAVAKDEFPKTGLVGLRYPIRDGDKEESKKDKPEYKSHWFITAKSMTKPGLIDAQKNEIIAPEEFYAGCYARATLTAFCYNTAGNKGVTFSLQNVQKLRDGEAFSGRTRAEDDFGPVDGGEAKGVEPVDYDPLG